MKIKIHFSILFINMVLNLANCSTPNKSAYALPQSETVEEYAYKIPQRDVQEFNTATHKPNQMKDILEELNIPKNISYSFKIKDKELVLVHNNEENDFIYVSKMPLSAQKKLLAIATLSTYWIYGYIRYLIENGVHETGKKIQHPLNIEEKQGLETENI